MTENEWFKKYGEFLEEMCERVMADRPVAIAVSYTTENGAVGTGYFECTMANKLTMAGMMLNDADSPRYKALGNSIAIPFWAWMAGRICAMYDRPVLLGSLFDGIGGFPLAFSRHGAVPVWASEIEEFPIAVTKKHFPEEEIT